MKIRMSAVAMLGAMLQGIEDGVMPPPAQDPLHPGEGAPLPVEWGAAQAAFAASARAEGIFPGFQVAQVTMQHQRHRNFPKWRQHVGIMQLCKNRFGMHARRNHDGRGVRHRWRTPVIETVGDKARTQNQQDKNREE